MTDRLSAEQRAELARLDDLVKPRVLGCETTHARVGPRGGRMLVGLITSAFPLSDGEFAYMTVDMSRLLSMARTHLRALLAAAEEAERLRAHLAEAEVEIKALAAPDPDDPDDADIIGHMLVDTVSNRVNEGAWHDEFREWYKPGEWLGSHRGAASFLGGKFDALRERAERAEASEASTLSQSIKHLREATERAERAESERDAVQACYDKQLTATKEQRLRACAAEAENTRMREALDCFLACGNDKCPHCEIKAHAALRPAGQGGG